MRILPAPAGSGIVFRRTDLDNFQIPATGRNVAKVSYATSLMRKGVLISTTEHLLSAFVGMGMDNAIVELDNLELPILDGSALPIVELLQPVGLQPQRRRRQYLRMLKPVEVRDGNKFIGVYPGEATRVCYSIDFPHRPSAENRSASISRPATMRATLPRRAPSDSCKTSRSLRNMGLIRGASEENAIVLTRDGIQNGPLRFPDEFVRHKVLDLIGDLALIGHRCWAASWPSGPDTPCTPRWSAPAARPLRAWELATLERGKPQPSPAPRLVPA